MILVDLLRGRVDYDDTVEHAFARMHRLCDGLRVTGVIVSSRFDLCKSCCVEAAKIEAQNRAVLAEREAAVMRMMAL